MQQHILVAGLWSSLAYAAYIYIKPEILPHACVFSARQIPPQSTWTVGDVNIEYTALHPTLYARATVHGAAHGAATLEIAQVDTRAQSVQRIAEVAASRHHLRNCQFTRLLSILQWRGKDIFLDNFYIRWGETSCCMGMCCCKVAFSSSPNTLIATTYKSIKN